MSLHRGASRRSRSPEALTFVKTSGGGYNRTGGDNWKPRLQRVAVAGE